MDPERRPSAPRAAPPRPSPSLRAALTRALLLTPLAACVIEAPAASTHDDPATDTSAIPDLPAVPPHAYSIDPDPPPDWQRSPYTGWTRAHYEAVFARLLHGAFSHLSEHGARLELGDDDPLSTAGFEGIARTLLGLGYWLQNPGNPARIEYRGHEMDLVELSRRALVHGTDPADPDYWGAILDHQQGVVEAAWIAEFLLRSEARVWTRLSPAERDQVMTWLRPAEKRYDTNWALFEATRDLARRRLGYPTTPGELEASLDAVEAGYAGDGWYADGDPRRFDYYNAYVIHPSLLLWASELGDDAERRARIHARARAFLHHFPYFFGADGAPIVFGRSLTYRFAILAALQAAVVAEVSPLAPGLARRLSSGNLRFHAGAPTQEGRLFDGDDLPQLGFVADEPNLVEPYIDTGSLYLTMRGFQVLALADDHPFWSATEAPMPADGGAWSHAIPAIGVVLHKADADEGVRMQSVATYKANAEYAGAYNRLGYGSALTFDTTLTGPPYAYDRLVTTSSVGEFSQLRRAPSFAQAHPGGTSIAYTIKPEALAIWYEDDRVTSVALAVGGDDPMALELRLSCVTPSVDGSTRVYEGGTAVGGTAPPTATTQDLWSYVEGDDGASLLAGLAGYVEAGPQLGLQAEALAHALAPHASFPSLRGPSTGAARCYLSAAVVRESGFDPEDALAQLAAIEVDDATAHARVDFSNGDAIWLSAAEVPEVETIGLGEVNFTGPLRSAYALTDGSFGAAGVADASALSLAVVLDAPGDVECGPPHTGCRICAIDRPAGFTLADPSEVAGLRVDGDWIAIPEAIVGDDEQVRVDEDLLVDFGTGQELTRSTFRLCGAAP